MKRLTVVRHHSRADTDRWAGGCMTSMEPNIRREIRFLNGGGTRSNGAAAAPRNPRFTIFPTSPPPWGLPELPFLSGRDRKLAHAKRAIEEMLSE